MSVTRTVPFRALDDEQKRALLTDVVGSLGWQDVIRPALLRRQAAIKEKLAGDRRISLEEVRSLQGLYTLLRELSEQPAEFFLNTAEIE